MTQTRVWIQRITKHFFGKKGLPRPFLLSLPVPALLSVLSLTIQNGGRGTPPPQGPKSEFKGHVKLSTIPDREMVRLGANQADT